MYFNQVIINSDNTVNIVEEISLPIVQTAPQDIDVSGIDSTWANLGDIMTERLEADQFNHSYQIESLAQANLTQQTVPGPTGPNPSLDTYPGDYRFQVKFHRLSDNIKNKSWDVSYLFLFYYLISSLLKCTYNSHNSIENLVK